jgi:diacylglycerol O-acyltransferase
MQNQPHTDHLSWGDSVFLNLEREGMPLNVACVCVLEGDIAFDAFLQDVESKLPLMPRYFQRVTAPALNIGLPSWEDAPDFDIRNHVREARLAHGSDAELKAMAGEMFSQVMDREHPLWDMTLVHGLKRERTALIVRLHHCLADGIAGVGLMGVLMNASQAAPPDQKHLPHVAPPRDAVSSLVGAVASSYFDAVKRLLSASAGVLQITARAVADAKHLADDHFARLLPEIAAPTERLCFNVIYHGPQKFAWTEIPLAAVKAIRHACGTSVNDVLLALMTATIRRYSELHGDQMKKRLLRVMVPVNQRGSDRAGALGNRISLIPVTIPLDIGDPLELLTVVHQRTEFLKHAHAAEMVGLSGGLLGIIPSPIQTLVGPLISQLPITPFNMVCTNVPGPQSPLFLLGHKMLRWYPYVPIGGELALNCAMLSYNGMVYFGFSGDAHAVPDLRRLEKLLKLSFTELRAAARVRAAAKKRRSSK